MERRSTLLLVLVLAFGCDGSKSGKRPVATVPLGTQTDASTPRTEAVTDESTAPGPTDGGASSGKGPTNLWRDAGPSTAPTAIAIEVDGPSPEPLAVDVRNATELVIYDTWSGLGSTYAVVIALRKSGAFFTYEAKVSAYPNSLGEPIPEAGGCKCAIGTACPCERDRGATRKQGRVAARAVAELLTVFGTRPLDLRQTFKNERRWTDDYPYVHMVATVPGKSPVHFTAADQSRHWTRDGKYLHRSPDEPTGGMEPEHRMLNSAVQTLEKAIGVDVWLAEEHKLNPSAGPL